MKKFISMLAVLCMLITSMPMIVSADDAANTATFENTMLVKLNKNATEVEQLLIDSSGNVLSNWPEGSMKIEEETNNSGEKFKSLKKNDHMFVGTDVANQQLYNQVLNKDKTTYELWVKASDIGAGQNERKNIFYTGTGLNYATQYADGTHQAVIQSLFVRNGKLVYEIAQDKNPHVVGEYDLSSKANEYVYAVLTRELDKTVAEKPKIKYIAYFDGKKVGEYIKESDVNATSPDGDKFFFGGFFDTTQDSSLKNNPVNLFSGNIAEFNVFEDIATQDVVTTRYNAKKATYTLPKDFKEYKVAYVNKSATNVNSWIAKPNSSKLYYTWRSTNNFPVMTSANVNGKEISYLKNDGSSEFWLGAGGVGEADTTDLFANKEKTSFEMWVSLDNILKGYDSRFQTLFYIFHKNYNPIKNGSLNIYVQDGKLKQSYNYNQANNTVDIPLDDYKREFVHIFVSRDINKTDKTITYKTYFNGELKDTVTLENVSEDTLNTPDGVRGGVNQGMDVGFFLLGGWYSGSENFKGKLAEFNAYAAVPQNDEVVANLYNENKDVYKLPISEDAEMEDFNDTKLIQLNKSTTDKTKMLVKASGIALGNWGEGGISIAEELNDKGETIKSLKADPNAPGLLGAGGDGEKPLKEHMMNKDKTTYEFWVKPNDIAQGNTKRKNIFYTGSGMNYATQYDLNSSNQSIFVQNGKLVYEVRTGDKTYYKVAEYDLSKKAGQYIHAVITKELDKTDATTPTLKYVVYIDGVKVGEYSNTTLINSMAEASRATHDGNHFFLGGFYDASEGKTLSKDPTNFFSGNIAEFNVYNEIASQNVVTNLYNKNKDVYTVPYENVFNASKAVELNFETTTFKTPSGTTLGAWVYGKPELKSEKNMAGEQTQYIEFTGESVQLIAADNTTEHPVRNLVINNPETTIDMWVKVDDILKENKNNFKSIFYTYDHEVKHDTNANNRWHLYVQDGKLKQSYKNTAVCEDIDLTNFEGEFIHVSITRKVDANNNTMTFKTYFNGVPQTAYTLSVTDSQITEDDIVNPDGDPNVVPTPVCKSGFYLGSRWDEVEGNRFDGGIAKFDVYHQIMNDVIASKIHTNEEKSYSLYRNLIVNNIVFMDSDEDIISTLKDYEGSLVVGTKLVNDLKTDESVFVALAIYDANGKLIDLSFSKDGSNVTVSAGKEKTIGIVSKNLTKNEAATAKVLVWLGDSMKPIDTLENVEIEINSAQEGL